MNHAFSKTKFLALAAALIASVLSTTPASALTAPKRQALAGASSDAVTKVHIKRHYHKHHHKYAHRHHRRQRIVEAPFTRVETSRGYRRDVLVDAPFAFVAVNRHGRYVRAPFVDLWIPN